MDNMVYCNNCGRLGHQYHQCKLPITSYGIITFRINKKCEIEYLLIRRKDTLGYVDFIRGKYPQNNIQHISNMLCEMTIDEKKNLYELEFKELWNTILKERKTGYDHRKPKRKSKKSKNLTPNSLENLKNKTKKLFTNTEVNTNIDNKSKNIVIRVRTESFSK